MVKDVVGMVWERRPPVSMRSYPSVGTTVLTLRYRWYLLIAWFKIGKVIRRHLSPLLVVVLILGGHLLIVVGLIIGGHLTGVVVVVAVEVARVAVVVKVDGGVSSKDARCGRHLQEQ